METEHANNYLEFRVQGFPNIRGPRLRVPYNWALGLGFRVQSLGFGVQGLGFWGPYWGTLIWGNYHMSRLV